MTALALLILLQFVVATLSLRSNGFERLVKSAPQFLYRDGRYLEEAMKKERIRKEEILQNVSDPTTPKSGALPKASKP